ncbi:MAG: alpha/beta hydrolase [Gammaproteobacteria bacterium]
MNKLDYIQLNPKTEATHSVIWLHGLGADGHDFVNIVPELKLPEDHGVRFIFPHAPLRAVTINNGYVMRAWYDILSLDRMTQEDEDGVRNSVELVSYLIEEEHQRGIHYNNIFLAGFSQGAALALFTGLSYPHKLGGIIALSGYLPLVKLVQDEVNERNKHIPIFQAHGTFDMVVPFTLAEMAKSFLTAMHYPVEWHTYPIDHGVSPDEVIDISHWLQSKIA